MDKASKAFRRSSVRLKSIGSGHAELNLVISELKEVRATAKAFLSAQNSASLQLVRWAQADENWASRDTFAFLLELNSLWTDVQKEFTEHLKEFKTHFDLILEGEKHVDQARTAVALCDQRENKIKKEIKKANKRFDSFQKGPNLHKQLCESVKAREIAQMEVQDRYQENEAVKLIRIKEGLLKLSESYIELANKCKIIFEAHRDIAYQLPDVQGKDLQDITYTGGGVSQQAVVRAKEQVHSYKRRSHNLKQNATTPAAEDPPPPYSATPPYNPAYCGGLYDQAQGPYYYPTDPVPSTSRDVPDGPSCSRDHRSSNGRRRGNYNFSSDNGRFFRRRRETRPQSMPGPSTSTNPFYENTDPRQRRTTDGISDSLAATRLGGD